MAHAEYQEATKEQVNYMRLIVSELVIQHAPAPNTDAHSRRKYKELAQYPGVYSIFGTIGNSSLFT